jgi:hypothetical protein
MSGSGSGNSEFTTYRSKELGFVINGPSNWETPKYDESGFSLRFTPPGKTFEFLEISQHELGEKDKGRTPEEIAKKSIGIGKTIITIHESTQTFFGRVSCIQNSIYLWKVSWKYKSYGDIY